MRTNDIGFNIKLVQSILKQLFNSVAFIHGIGYIHTDFKPENIVFESQQYLS